GTEPAVDSGFRGGVDLGRETLGRSNQLREAGGFGPGRSFGQNVQWGDQVRRARARPRTIEKRATLGGGVLLLRGSQRATQRARGGRFGGLHATEEAFGGRGHVTGLRLTIEQALSSSKVERAEAFQSRARDVAAGLHTFHEVNHGFFVAL